MKLLSVVHMLVQTSQFVDEIRTFYQSNETLLQR